MMDAVFKTGRTKPLYLKPEWRVYDSAVDKFHGEFNTHLDAAMNDNAQNTRQYGSEELASRF